MKGRKSTQRITLPCFAMPSHAANTYSPYRIGIGSRSTGALIITKHYPTTRLTVYARVDRTPRNRLLRIHCKKANRRGPLRGGLLKTSESFHSSKRVDNLSGTARDRADMQDQWLAFLVRNVFKYKLLGSAVADKGFQINAQSRTDNGFTLARFETIRGKARLSRGPSEISADLSDRYVIFLSLRGALELSQFGRVHKYEPCSAALLLASDRLDHTKLGDNDTMCLLIPREFVDQRVLRAEDLCIRPPGPNSGVRHLFFDTLLAFHRDAPSMSDGEFAGSVRLVSELALYSITGARDLTSNLRSLRTSNLARIKRVIRTRFRDPDLTLNSIAQESRISLRYLHDLFRDDGRTAREYLVGERLQYARRQLETAASNRATVTSISMASGFSNASQFSAAFREAFGLSPRDVLRRR